jgi:uncharacterized peroxidase-related enzyme
MAFLSMVSEAEAAAARPDEVVKHLYARLQDEKGTVLDFWKAQACCPDAIDAQVAMHGSVMRDRGFEQRFKEQLGVVVSGLNTSSYCVALHMELLRQMGIEKPIGRKLATDYEHAPVGEREKALFRFADKLTQRPGDVTEDDVRALLGAGYTEAQVTEAVIAISWFNFLNRISLGLGLMAEF